jgi:hypothetical protein
MPGVRIPSFPLGGAILTGLSISLLKVSEHPVMGSSDVNLQQRERLALRIPKQTSNDARCAADLQMKASVGNGSVSDYATYRANQTAISTSRTQTLRR